MKLALAGTHCTGKTTLGIELQSRLPNAHLVTGIARTIIRDGYPLNMDATDASYAYYIAAQRKAEESADRYQTFISDRTLLDPLAYALVNRAYVNSPVSAETIHRLYELWLEERALYDYYLYLPIEFPMNDNGLRPLDDHYREQVDKKILELLTTHKIPYLTVSGTLERRTAIVLSLLKSGLNEGIV